MYSEPAVECVSQALKGGESRVESQRKMQDFCISGFGLSSLDSRPFKNGSTKLWPEVFRRSIQLSYSHRVGRGDWRDSNPRPTAFQAWTPNRQSIRDSCKRLNEVWPRHRASRHTLTGCGCSPDRQLRLFQDTAGEVVVQTLSVQMDSELAVGRVKTPVGVEPTGCGFAGRRHAVWLQRRGVRSVERTRFSFNVSEVVVAIDTIKSSLMRDSNS